jgi:hypothetical protein
MIFYFINKIVQIYGPVENYSEMLSPFGGEMLSIISQIESSSKSNQLKIYFNILGMVFFFFNKIVCLLKSNSS